MILDTDPINPPFVYILSTGRAGTKLIYQIMGKLYPELNITHQGKWSRLISIAGNILLIDGLPSHFIQKLFIYLKKQSKPCSTTDPLLSVPISLFLINRKIFTQYKIIHLVRDPREFVTSFINWKNQKIRRVFLHHCVPFWQPNPVFSENISIYQRMKMKKFHYFSWIWNFKNNFIAKSFAGKKNYCLVRMEDLVDTQEGYQNFKALFNFLELPNRNMDWDCFLNVKVNKSIRKRFPNWRNWNPKKAKVLDRYCGDLMRKYGYGNEESWIEKLQQE